MEERKAEDEKAVVKGDGQATHRDEAYGEMNIDIDRTDSFRETC